MISNKTKTTLVATAALATVGLDQWTKQLAITHLEGQPDVSYFDGLARLTFAKNTGAFLSLGENLGPYLKPILLNALPALLLVGLVYYIFRDRLMNRWQTVALALIVGGGLSNIIDRQLYGYVVDMLHIQLTDKLQTGIFNIADMAIMAGMFMMLPSVFRKENPDPTPGPDRPKTPAEKSMIE